MVNETNELIYKEKIVEYQMAVALFISIINYERVHYFSIQNKKNFNTFYFIGIYSLSLFIFGFKFEKLFFKS